MTSSKRTFHNVTQREIESVLTPRGFKRIQLPGVVELVYAKRVDQDDLCLSLRVFTGINPSGDSRECGEDAIRICLFWKDLTRADQRDSTKPRVTKISGEKRVNRIQTWRKNLAARLDNWDDLPKSKCPKCGSPVVLRHGKFGDFFGCAGFPDCDYKPKDEKK